MQHKPLQFVYETTLNVALIATVDQFICDNKEGKVATAEMRKIIETGEWLT